MSGGADDGYSWVNSICDCCRYLGLLGSCTAGQLLPPDAACFAEIAAESTMPGTADTYELDRVREEGK